MTESIGIFAIHTPFTAEFGLTKAVIFKARLSKCLFPQGFSGKCLIMLRSENRHSHAVAFMVTPV
jgi:hypothetical protein